MIKIFSFVLFVSAFIWTWCLFNSPSQMGTDIHAGIQSKLTILIEESVKANVPTMANFRLNKMYTEKLEDNKVKAHFSYQYDEADATTQTISGEAVLTKALSEDPNVQKWVLQSVNAGSQALEFKEGTTISSDGTTTSTEETPAVSATETTPAASAPAESH
ncbi:hypothetical protein [Pseudobdellovibrio sp. HCB154]|uniref:hypothetical protein n=1 Tax=Pseudobdellovibrio sp. HCB154 TaxID=3386277 RepID=UPI003916FF78